jgi:hypothetical protein
MGMERFQMWIQSSVWGKSPQNLHPFQENDPPSSPRTNLDISQTLLLFMVTHPSVDYPESHTAHREGVLR